MGYFSLKETCSVCGNICGLERTRIKKGWICAKCYKEVHQRTNAPMIFMTADDIKKIINTEIVDVKATSFQASTFQTTKEIGVFLKVDEHNKKWYIPDGLFGKTKNPRIHSYDDVLDFELLEDGGSVAKGGIGRAVAGGFLFGSIGAIVGGITGEKKSKPTCTSLKIKITLNDIATPTEYINFITTETKKSSIVYQSCEKQAHEIMSLFQIMCEQNKSVQNDIPQQTKEASVADEIKKYKELLDAGALTQEEFDAKKKQLLNL